MIELVNTTVPIDQDGYAVDATASFIDALTTRKRSVIGKPDYGTDLPKLKHRSFNTDWIIEFRRALKDACSHDPRLTFQNAIIDQSEIGLGQLSFSVDVGIGIIKGVTNVSEN